MLQRLELLGFKSFAGRATFDFEPGISALVGPNGSGKSNLADAVRWVLGEQSARALRSRKAEEVIFVGSNGRYPLGMAEVELQREGGHQEEGEGGEQREPVSGPHGFDFEHALERGKDEGARHEAGDVGIENDEEAPLELHLVGVHEAVDAGNHKLTSPPRPDPCI